MYLAKNIDDTKLNKNPLSYLLSTYISARLAPQIMSLKYGYLFRFSSFLITGLCNSSANFRVPSKSLATQTNSEGHWFDVNLILIADLFRRIIAPPKIFPPKDFL